MGECFVSFRMQAGFFPECLGYFTGKLCIEVRPDSKVLALFASPFRHIIDVHLWRSAVRLRSCQKNFVLVAVSVSRSTYNIVQSPALRSEA